MTSTDWTITPDDGQFLVKTGVAGRAAKMGHRLTIAADDWKAVVRWADGAPAELEVTVQVNSLQVVHGEGGVKPLSDKDKVAARSNALSVLQADRFAEIRFQSTSIDKTDDGYRVGGTLQICGKSHPQVLDLRVEQADGRWQMSCDTEVRHSDFGLKPLSMFLGSMKVTDAVTVSVTAERAVTP